MKDAQDGWRPASEPGGFSLCDGCRPSIKLQPKVLESFAPRTRMGGDEAVAESDGQSMLETGKQKAATHTETLD